MAAQRYGGPHSPQSPDDRPVARTDLPPNRFRNRRASNVSLFARLTYLVPLPLLLAGLGEIASADPVGATVEIGSFAILMLGAVLLNEGLKAEAAYDARTIAKPPAIPRKAFAAICAAAGVGIATAFATAAGPVGGILFGAMAGAAHLFAFGLDPMKRKGGDGVSEFESDRVARAVDAAEETVSEILAQVRRVGDRRLESRVEQMLTHVRELFRAVEADPRDLTRARKFLGVYLVGARDATRKFADLYTKRRDPEARADYEALLTDLETSFRTHRQDLLANDKTRLDVEIEVLRERLHREGV